MPAKGSNYHTTVSRSLSNPPLEASPIGSKERKICRVRNMQVSYLACGSVTGTEDCCCESGEICVLIWVFTPTGIENSLLHSIYSIHPFYPMKMKCKQSLFNFKRTTWEQYVKGLTWGLAIRASCLLVSQRDSDPNFSGGKM